MTLPALLRQNIRDMSLSPEALILKDLQADYGPTATQRQRIARAGADLVSRIRHETKPGVMDLFLADYGLSSEEGIALMCLAEALLRVPDTATMDDLIEDKIASSDWAIHLGKSSSSLINASTWALMLTGKVLQNPQEHRLTDILRTTIKRMGEPVIRRAATQAMKIMGHQFVLGETIQDAVRRAKPQEDQGYTYSYDMLAEAALTQSDADIFFESYTTAISYLAPYAIHTDQRENPGISIKLSALHPRYEQGQAKRVIAELVPRVLRLAQAAARANMGLNIDAEEADRLDLSLDVIEAVLRDPSLKGWDGLGVVVQAYGKRAGPVIDWLHAMACDLDRKIMVRLVKGAYWDTEIKHAQVLGLPDYPVFTTKPATDVSYLCCAQKLLRLSDRLYPQFATHNAHTIAAILDMAAPEQQPEQRYEFQRLHGMGEAVHALVKTDQKTRCRIYAPVGVHRDLLAYLVRRLLENGANSSFVNQLVDTTVPPETLAADPFEHLSETALPKPPMLYHPDRENSAGWNLQTPDGMAHFKKARAPFATTKWAVGPILRGWQGAQSTPHNTVVGSSRLATKAQADHALAVAKPWGLDAAKRADILRQAANLYEEAAGEFFALLAREAGKTAQDAVDELREAVDFLRFYANEGLRLGDTPARGIITCISPWNFPLAIFTGQIAAALAAGNGVLAKPADPTPAIAHLATRLLHRAGIPVDALQLLPGDGPGIGAMLTSNSRVNGVCFTGSTAVAQTINRTIAERLAPDACLIAETGGINAMIVDSTALPEQAVKDIVDGAFRSAGQRCSALRVLYVQADIAGPFLRMLYGAMDQLTVGEPWQLDTDVGPIITKDAHHTIQQHIDAARQKGRLLKHLPTPETERFIGPAVIQIDGIKDLEAEIFGPVLHVATFKAHQLDHILEDINTSGYGLTFGLHTRIDGRIDAIRKRLRVGNMYVNRNQIGAVVESQPFGGEGLSGTGPKAGGPHYVDRFKGHSPLGHTMEAGPVVDHHTLQAAVSRQPDGSDTALHTRIMRGPTGELNQWSTHPRGTVLCLGPTREDAMHQMRTAQAMGCGCVGVAPGLTGAGTCDGVLAAQSLARLEGVHLAVFWGTADQARAYRTALAARSGPIIPLVTDPEFATACLIERHLCVDITAVGGNTDLMA